MSTSWSTTQIIGRLIPVNKEAKRAFNDVAKAVRCDEASTEPIDLRHASQFMVINSNLQVWANATDTTTDDNASSTEALTDVDAGTTENDSESPKPIPLEFQGYYSLSFKQLPYSPPFGWLIGVGRKDNASTSRSTRKVDIQLALQEFRKRYEVAGWHAHISFDREMGSLVVAAASGRCPELVLGSDQITRGQRVVTQVKNRVKFGRLEYSLEFDTSDANGYQKALSEFFE